MQAALPRSFEHVKMNEFVQAASFLDDKDTIKYVAEQFAPYLTNVKSFEGEEYREICEQLEEIPALVQPTVDACLDKKPAGHASGPGSLIINFMQLPPPLHPRVLQRHYHSGHLNLQCMLMHDSTKEGIVTWVFEDIGQQIGQLSPIRAFNLCNNCLPDALANNLLQGLATHTSLLSLRLRSNCMGELSATTLHALLTTALSSVQTMDLSENTFSNTDLNQITQAFPTLHHLKHLTLCDVGLTGAAAAPCFRQIMLLRSLHTLDLSNNNLGDEGLAALGSVIATTPSMPSVTRLALTRVECGSEGARVLGQSLHHMHSLKALVFLENKRCGDEGASCLFSGLSCLPEFVELTLQDVGLTTEFLSTPLSGLTNLTKLDLSRNWFVGTFPGPVAAAIACMPALKGVVLSANSIGRIGCKAIASSIAHCPLIEEIDLSQNRIGLTGATALAEAVAAVRSTLVTLSISYNQMGDEGLLGIVSALWGDPPVIEALDLTRNYISNQFLEKLGPLLPRLDKLRSVHVEQHRPFGLQMQHFGQQYQGISIVEGKDLIAQFDKHNSNTSWKALAKHCSDMKATFFVT